MQRRIAFQLAALLLGSFLGATIARAQTTLPPMEARARIAETVTATNRERIRQGLPPLTPHPALMAAAQAHADDMARYGYFRHTDRQGREPAQRARAQGFPTSMVGENLALGPHTAPETIALWRDSPGHRANLLRRAFDVIGVGLAVGPAGWYWVQLFGQSAAPALARPDPDPARPVPAAVTVRLAEIDTSGLNERGGSVWVHAEIGGDGEYEVGLILESPDGVQTELPLRRANLSNPPQYWSFEVPLDAERIGTPGHRYRLRVFVRDARGTVSSEPAALEPLP